MVVNVYHQPLQQQPACPRMLRVRHYTASGEGVKDAVGGLSDGRRGICVTAMANCRFWGYDIMRCIRSHNSKNFKPYSSNKQHTDGLQPGSRKEKYSLQVPFVLIYSLLVIAVCKERDGGKVEGFLWLC
jgi:hypothetical protein